MTMAFDPSATPILQTITYNVTTTGDSLFHSTIASSDSPDYTADKAEVSTQCVAVSPLAEERVVS